MVNKSLIEKQFYGKLKNSQHPVNFQLIFPPSHFINMIVNVLCMSLPREWKSAVKLPPLSSFMLSLNDANDILSNFLFLYSMSTPVVDKLRGLQNFLSPFLHSCIPLFIWSDGKICSSIPTHRDLTLKISLWCQKEIPSLSFNY